MTREEERELIESFINENQDNPDKYKVIPPVNIGDPSGWDNPDTRKKLISNRKRKPTPYQKK